VLAAERGDHAEAGRLWKAVLAERPGDREALARLGPAAANSPRRRPRKIMLTVNRIAPVQKTHGSNDHAEYSAVMG
jgi:hypothetical protein